MAETNKDFLTAFTINNANTLNIFKNGTQEKYKQNLFAAWIQSLAEVITLALELEKFFQTEKIYVKNKITVICLFFPLCFGVLFCVNHYINYINV